MMEEHQTYLPPMLQDSCKFYNIINWNNTVNSRMHMYVYRWLDKLGLAAVINHTRVLRQTFIGGNYGLLDIDRTPLPVRIRARNIYIHTKDT